MVSNLHDPDFQESLLKRPYTSPVAFQVAVFDLRICIKGVNITRVWALSIN